MKNESRIKNFIERWPSARDLAAAARVTESAVSQWKRRNSIPRERWPAVITMAKRLGLSFVTTDYLLRLHRRN